MKDIALGEGLVTNTVYVVQKFRGTKLLRLDHHVSIRRNTFAFASKTSAGTNVYFPHLKVLLLKRTNVRIIYFT